MCIGEFILTTKINSFNLSTDFSSLRNDDNGTFTLVVPGSANIGASSSASYTADLTVGAQASASRVKIESSRDPGKWYINSRAFNRTGTSGGFPSGYTMYVSTYRISATQVRVEASFNNPYGATLTTQAGNETLTINVRTMILPF